LRCLDAGASTGGFTDCLLQRGATAVVAVDVGTDQLHPRLRSDPRVESRERTDIRTLEPDHIGGPAGFTVADLSFISLRLVLPAVSRLTAPEAPVVALVKPQFEVGRAEAARRQGIIRRPATWRLVLDEVAASADDLDMSLRDATVAGVPGAGGNVEFVVWLSRAGTGGPAVTGESAAVLDRVVAEAAERAGVVR
ncbi:MAG: TlyA family RNA methyltransferase, partial [Acidimicrobiia bacterium]|nr:TlyA family RNA methyltransferase [Acidimicrobiia bacterium]